MTKRWTEEEVSILKEELLIGSSHEDIGKVLGRTKSAIMHKVQKERLSKSFKKWDHLTVEDLKALVLKYRVSTEFDLNPELPGYKTVITRLGLETWQECLKFCGADTNVKGRYYWDKPAIFYILECKDTDGTIFRKYGVTQRSIKLRYGHKNYKIIEETHYSSLRDAINREQEMKQSVKHYKPNSTDFYKNGHGGYTECYRIEEYA